MAKSKMKKWAGTRIEFQGWWVPGEGEMITGVLLQKARAGGRFKQGHYVLQLTESGTANPFGSDESKVFEPGQKVAIPDNYNLEGLDELCGYEVEITCTKVNTFMQPTYDGGEEERTVKTFTILHSEEPVSKEIAAQYGKKPAR